MDKIVSCDDLFLCIRAQAVCTGKIYQFDLPVSEFKNSLLFFDGNARPVSYVKAGSGYRVDESGFSGVGIAGDSDSNGRGNPA